MPSRRSWGGRGGGLGKVGVIELEPMPPEVEGVGDGRTTLLVLPVAAAGECVSAAAGGAELRRGVPDVRRRGTGRSGRRGWGAEATHTPLIPGASALGDQSLLLCPLWLGAPVVPAVEPLRPVEKVPFLPGCCYHGGLEEEREGERGVSRGCEEGYLCELV